MVTTFSNFQDGFIPNYTYWDYALVTQRRNQWVWELLPGHTKTERGAKYGKGKRKEERQEEEGKRKKKGKRRGELEKVEKGKNVRREKKQNREY